ncbi:MAG TPA: ABC transporter substrate-binding protein [Geminicoccaceae bacterium]|nr:ABC transporter substrate-binding protein [Geminicoccaceae bacterium]
MSDEWTKDGRSAAPDAVTRRSLLKGAAALTITGPALAALLSGDRRAYAQAIDCLGLPPEALEQDLTLTAAYAASPPALDEIAFTMETENLLALTYGGDLVQYNPVYSEQYGMCVADMAAPGDESVTGRWAESWESSPDGLVWTFRIRPGIRSWAGNELTAEDIKWTWERGFEMRSVRYFFSTVMFLDSPDAIEAVDRYTVRFTSSAPSTNFLKLMAMNYYGGPFDSTEAKKHATASDPFAKEWLKSNDAGFGPYHVVRHVPGQEMALERNPHYEPRPPVGRILIRIVPDPATRMALLQRGVVDYAMRLPERNLQTLERDPNVQVIRYVANFIPYVGPVQTNEIMAKPAVRRAMAYAVPYEEILEKVYFGQGTIIKSITPAIFPNYTDEFWPYHLDLDRAKEMLSEAGYPDGFDLTLSYDNSISEMAEAAVLIKATFDAVGIRTSLDPLPAAVYSERKARRELMCQVDNFQWPWVADTGYTSWVYLANPDRNIQNSVYFNNPEFNELVTTMMRTPYGAERDAMDRRAQQICGEEVPWIYLVNPGWREALRAGWTNFHWNPDNNVHFHWLYKKA